VSSRQVERAIKAWRDAGVLTRTGSRKTGRWAVSGSEASDETRRGRSLRNEREF
jgi:predicted HTH transcriptional regulator